METADRSILWRILYILALTSYVRAYSMGATSESCVTLGIDHTRGDGSVIAPAPFESWYRITIPDNGDTYQASQTVRVVIEVDDGTSFNGFILQARSSNTGTPVGRWTDIPANTKAFSCSSVNDTITHESAMPMLGLELGWTPSQSYGQVEFWASVSANYRVFWNNLRSRNLTDLTPSTVTPRSNATSFGEDAGQFSISICAEPASSSNITVALEVIPLAGTDSGLSVPESVVVPGGTDCIRVDVTLEDDLIPEDDGVYLISVRTDAPLLSGAPIIVTILDDDDSCSMSPCVNNGTCILSGDTYECQCAPGYTGDTCAEEVIIPSVVSLRGAASSIPEDTGQFTISVCAEPPPSSDVEVVIQVVPQSSIDHGLSVLEDVVITEEDDCIEVDVDFEDDLIPTEDGMYFIYISSVTPPNQFSNDTISIIIEDNDDACSISPCANDGTCSVTTSDGFDCQCAYGYLGENCTEEEMFLPVTLSPRTLSLTEGTDGEITVCYNGGPNVSTIYLAVNLDTASSQDFQMSELAVEVTQDEPCATLMISAIEDNLVEEVEEFSVEITEVLVDTNNSLRLDEREISTVVMIMDIVIYPCDSNPCQNQGQCTNIEDDSFECLCTEGWSGQTCNRRIVIPCSSSPCSSGATCTNIGEVDFDCACPEGFVGRDCSLSNPCLNDQEICNNVGECSMNGDGTVRCDCNEGFYGINCEISEECLLSPCRNGGSCISTLGSPVRCECTSRFFGDYCELNNLCYGNPCLNGGRCESLPNSFRCNCPEGITGTICDIIISAPRPCAFNPCRNEGTCVAVDGRAECRCPAGWDGPICDRRVPIEVACPLEIAGFCQNGATCLASTIDPSNRRCICPSQYTGTMCEIRMVQAVTVEPNNPCEPNPCQNNGLCFAVDQDRFSCTCTKDFLTGELCDVCVTNHCSNGGTCGAVKGERTCECPAGVTGDSCERVEICDDFECNNGGFCIVVGGIPVCQCRDGFTGSRCEESDPCTGVSCLNGGNCVDGLCLCTGGFGGDFCENESGARSAALSGFLASNLVIAACLTVAHSSSMFSS